VDRFGGTGEEVGTGWPKTPPKQEALQCRPRINNSQCLSRYVCTQVHTPTHRLHVHILKPSTVIRSLYLLRRPRRTNFPERLCHTTHVLCTRNPLSISWVGRSMCVYACTEYVKDATRPFFPSLGIPPFNLAAPRVEQCAMHCVVPITYDVRSTDLQRTGPSHCLLLLLTYYLVVIIACPSQARYASA